MGTGEITLYSRPGCHLCDEMKAVVAPIAAELGWAVVEINIETDPALEAAYGTEIPVLLVSGRKAFKYHATAAELRRRLGREANPGPTRG